MADGHQPTDWPDALSRQETIALLRELASVAAGDARHDFGTVLDIFNDRARLAQKSGLSQSACQEIIRAVRLSIPDLGEPSVWRSDLLVVNRHLFRRRNGRSGEAARQVLPELFRKAAEHVEASTTATKAGSKAGAPARARNGRTQ